MAVEIEQFMCRSDNFGVLVRDTASGETALIDANHPLAGQTLVFDLEVVSVGSD